MNGYVIGCLALSMFGTGCGQSDRHSNDSTRPEANSNYQAPDITAPGSQTDDIVDKVTSPSSETSSVPSFQDALQRFSRYINITPNGAPIEIRFPRELSNNQLQDPTGSWRKAVVKNDIVERQRPARPTINAKFVDSKTSRELGISCPLHFNSEYDSAWTCTPDHSLPIGIVNLVIPLQENESLTVPMLTYNENISTHSLLSAYGELEGAGTYGDTYYDGPSVIAGALIESFPIIRGRMSANTAIFSAQIVGRNNANNHFFTIPCTMKLTSQSDNSIQWACTPTENIPQTPGLEIQIVSYLKSNEGISRYFTKEFNFAKYVTCKFPTMRTQENHQDWLDKNYEAFNKCSKDPSRKNKKSEEKRRDCACRPGL